MKVSLHLSVVFAASVLVDGSEASSGSYFIVYPGDAPENCVVEAGEMVDATCCMDVGPQFGLVRDTFPSNCYVLEGLLGENGGSLMSYLGCDDGTPYYGEACYNNGENGGIIPPGTVVEDTNVTDIGECGTGCTFQVSGNGCHKIRDFSSLPGFSEDTRQVFLYMDETCEGGEDMTPPGDTSPASSPYALELTPLLLAAVGGAALASLLFM